MNNKAHTHTHTHTHTHRHTHTDTEQLQHRFAFIFHILFLLLLFFYMFFSHFHSENVRLNQKTNIECSKQQKKAISFNLILNLLVSIRQIYIFSSDYIWMQKFKA